jgi:dipeptidyl aminopeptidase/acylaminoacyl peptidase
MFEVDGQAVLGVFHYPRERAGRVPAIVILHGFVGSKDQPHQIFVKLSEALAAAGVASLRIDLRGRGDSEGDTCDFTYASDMADVRAALDWLAARPEADPGRLGVAGMSWGATLAACTAGEDARVRAAALIAGSATIHTWNPPLREVEGRQVFEIFCNLVGGQFYESIRGVRPLEILARSRGPVLIAHGTADEDVPLDNARQFAVALGAAGVPYELALFEGADHVFMQHEQERALIERATAFFGAALA